MPIRRYTNAIWNSLNNQSTHTHAGVITRSLTPRRDEDPKMEDSISGSANQTQTLLHYQTQEQKYCYFLEIES